MLGSSTGTKDAFQPKLRGSNVPKADIDSLPMSFTSFPLGNLRGFRTFYGQKTMCSNVSCEIFERFMGRKQCVPSNLRGFDHSERAFHETCEVFECQNNAYWATLCHGDAPGPPPRVWSILRQVGLRQDPCEMQGETFSQQFSAELSPAWHPCLMNIKFH